MPTLAEAKRAIINAETAGDFAAADRMRRVVPTIRGWSYSRASRPKHVGKATANTGRNDDQLLPRQFYGALLR